MAVEQESNFGAFLVRAVFALIIHLVLAALLFGIVVWLTSDTASVHPDVLREVQGQSDSQQSIEFALEDARGALLQWAMWSLATGFAASAIFLFAAQQQLPRIPSEERALSGLWAGLFIVGVIASVVVWWLGVADAGVDALIVSGSYFGCSAAGFFGVVIAYYLATALCVKPTMKPSVPLSAPLPSLKR